MSGTSSRKAMGIVALLALGFVVGFVVGTRTPRFWPREGPAASMSSARIAANETVGIAMLRNLSASQAQFQQSAWADTDNDGNGAYGGFMELSGVASGRAGTRLSPPVLPSLMGRLNEHGEANRSGYLYRIYLPGRDGVGVGEPVGGYTDDDPLDEDLAETRWCCYAWPERYGETGRTTFFVDQDGTVLATDAAVYSGPGAGPAAEAVSGSRGQDGNVWVEAN